MMKIAGNRARLVSLSAVLMLNACAVMDNKNTVESSYLKGQEANTQVSDEVEDSNQTKTQTKPSFSRLESLEREGVTFTDKNLAEAFDNERAFKVAANQMEVTDFLHYVLGELLDVNYVLTPDVTKARQNVTLSINKQVTAQRLFTLTEEVLSERGMQVGLNDGVYVVNTVDPKSKAATRVGVGRETESVPRSAGEILQIVPVLYGINAGLKRTVEQLTEVSVSIDVNQSKLFFKGERASIVRALELIQLLDSPANRGRHVGVVDLAYIDVGLYLDQISTLLKNEGIPNSINEPDNNNLVFVPLHQIGAVAIFSATESLLERVKYWTDTLDKPSEGDVKRYYVFHPQYARATDIGASLKPLLGAASGTTARANVNASSNAQDSQGSSTGQTTQTNRTMGGSGDDITFVVDERSNSLIFYTTGTKYKSIIPLVQKLDMLPKQVLLEVVIAEVKLTDNYSQGLQWTLSEGEVNLGFDGTGLSVAGGAGVDLPLDEIRASFSAEDSNVKVLSRPSLLVRDGVSATINVGDKISVQTSSTGTLNGNNNIITQNEYIQTGINVTVKPTVNAQGVVIMSISQSLSNTSGAGQDGNPDIFNRNINTEVVAESGQTVVLAGLIDEQETKSENKTPGLGDLPILGNLFKKQSDSNVRTELVLMITPKVISRSDQWEGILSDFKSSLSGIEIN